jgi:hypothetical protein
MVLGELALNRVPPCTWLGLGAVAAWNSAFAVWSALFARANRRFIYPFLGKGPASYLALYAGMFGAAQAFLWALRRKEAAAARRWAPKTA